MTGRRNLPAAALGRVLALEVALLEAEVALMSRLVDDKIIPPDARREPTPVELRAAVKFAELDRIVNDAAALLLRHTEAVRDHTLDGLAMGLTEIAGEPDPWRALETLERLTDPTRPDTIPGLAAVVEEVTEAIKADLIRTAQAGADEAIAEARRQGIPDRLLPQLDATALAEVESAAAAHATKVAKAPATRLLDVAAEAGARAASRPDASGGTVLEAALDGAEAASRAGTEDAARQAANVTHGLGRAAAQRQLPAPREVYASELLDRNTCGPCATVDGRTYQSLADALVDYPGAGGFVGCDGGSRCRGTLVLVHSSEAAPTLDNPGDGRPGGPPVDRTPRGPASNAPAPNDAPDEVLPGPDPGVPAQITDAVVGGLVDDGGRTVMPVEQIEDPVTTVDPGLVPRDPELAEYADHELEALLTADDVDLDRRIAAADELDQRAAGTRERVWREEDLDAETLARYEDEREAWEQAGGYAAQPTPKVAGKPAGRRIDAVRQEWADQLEMDYLAAEDATRGTLIARDKVEEFRIKYGANSAALFEGPARTAYYYASRELRDHWEAIGGRPTFAEFAVARGIDDAKMTARARSAAAARDDAAARADESAAGREKRARAKREAARKRLPKSAGDRLAAAQARRDRIRARERKLQAEAGDPGPDNAGDSPADGGGQ